MTLGLELKTPPLQKSIWGALAKIMARYSILALALLSMAAAVAAQEELGPDFSSTIPSYYNLTSWSPSSAAVPTALTLNSVSISGLWRSGAREGGWEGPDMATGLRSIFLPLDIGLLGGSGGGRRALHGLL